MGSNGNAYPAASRHQLKNPEFSHTAGIPRACPLAYPASAVQSIGFSAFCLCILATVICACGETDVTTAGTTTTTEDAGTTTSTETTTSATPGTTTTEAPGTTTETPGTTTTETPGTTTTEAPGTTTTEAPSQGNDTPVDNGGNWGGLIELQ